MTSERARDRDPLPNFDLYAELGIPLDASTDAAERAWRGGGRGGRPGRGGGGGGGAAGRGGGGGWGKIWSRSWPSTWPSWRSSTSGSSGSSARSIGLSFGGPRGGDASARDQPVSPSVRRAILLLRQPGPPDAWRSEEVVGPLAHHEWTTPRSGTS